jgi:hypothetical protein
MPAKAGIQRSWKLLDSGSRFRQRRISLTLKLYRQLGRNDACAEKSVIVFRPFDFAATARTHERIS